MNLSTSIKIVFSLIVTSMLSLYYDVYYLSVLSLFYSFFVIKNLFDTINTQFPFKGIILSLLCLQMLVSPYLEYHYFHNEVFGHMSVDEHTYFSYVFPAILCFHLGLSLFYPKKPIEKITFNLIKFQKRTNVNFGIVLIFVGIVFSSFYAYLPGIIRFVALPFSFMRFVGFFYLWFAKSKYTIPAGIIVWIPYIMKTLGSTIFIDLIMWSFFICSAYLIKNSVAHWKVYTILIIGFFALMMVQSVKYGVRQKLWFEDYSGSTAALFATTLIEQYSSIRKIDFKEIGKLVNIRVNQGWILSDIMKHIPKEAPFFGGSYVKKELKGLLLPRFLYPDKPTVGDHKKFKDFTGWSLAKRTSMNVGVLGDGYANYGRLGGLVFCLAFGAFLGIAFQLFYRFVKKYPTLIFWGIVLFFYSMRAGNEFYIIANWLVKISFIVFVYFYLFERYNVLDKYLQVVRNYKNRRLIRL